MDTASPLGKTGILALAGLCWLTFANPAGAFFFGPKRAKHIIVMIGDGMGYWHVDATRRYLDDGPLAMERLRQFGYMTTFMLNSTGGGTVAGEYWDDASEVGEYDPARGGATPWELQPVPAYLRAGATDSAAAASAMANGNKTPKYALNVIAKDHGYPSDQPWTVKYFPTIVDAATSRNMATGLVTSVQFFHATPASFVAKTQYRRNHSEKIRQMAYSDVDVVMGAGHPGIR